MCSFFYFGEGTFSSLLFRMNNFYWVYQGSLFRFQVWKNPNELFGQPNIYSSLSPLTFSSVTSIVLLRSPSEVFVLVFGDFSVLKCLLGSSSYLLFLVPDISTFLNIYFNSVSNAYWSIFINAVLGFSRTAFPHLCHLGNAIVFSCRFWFFIIWVIWSCILDILNIMLQAFGSYLNPKEKHLFYCF